MTCLFLCNRWNLQRQILQLQRGSTSSALCICLLQDSLLCFLCESSKQTIGIPWTKITATDNFTQEAADKWCDNDWSDSLPLACIVWTPYFYDMELHHYLPVLSATLIGKLWLFVIWAEHFCFTIVHTAGEVQYTTCTNLEESNRGTWLVYIFFFWD